MTTDYCNGCPLLGGSHCPPDCEGLDDTAHDQEDPRSLGLTAEECEMYEQHEPRISLVEEDTTVASIRKSVLYGSTYQGQGASRHSRGIWKSFRGPGT